MVKGASGSWYRSLSGQNDHFRSARGGLAAAQQRGFQPRYALLDSWYARLHNLQAGRAQGWSWLTQLRSNRLVNPRRTGQRAGGNAGDPAPGTDRAFAGLRVGPGVSDRLHPRGRGALGHRRPDPDCARSARSGAAGLGDCGLPSRHQAALWGGKIAGAQGTALRNHIGGPCKPICGWKATDCAPGPIGTRPKRASSATRFGKVAAVQHPYPLPMLQPGPQVLLEPAHHQVVVPRRLGKKRCIPGRIHPLTPTGSQRCAGPGTASAGLGVVLSNIRGQPPMRRGCHHGRRHTGLSQPPQDCRLSCLRSRIPTTTVRCGRPNRQPYLILYQPRR